LTVALSAVVEPWATAPHEQQRRDAIEPTNVSVRCLLALIRFPEIKRIGNTPTVSLAICQAALEVLGDLRLRQRLALGKVASQALEQERGSR
jgi:hypothetical protein